MNYCNSTVFLTSEAIILLLVLSPLSYLFDALIDAQFQIIKLGIVFKCASKLKTQSFLTVVILFPRILQKVPVYSLVFLFLDQ